MADRAYCQIEIAAAYLEELEDLFDGYGFALQDESPSDNGTLIFEDIEARYDADGIRKELDNAKVPYFGYHDTGGGDGASVFAGDGTESAESAGAEGRPMCTIMDDGEPDPDSVAAARAYLRVKRHAKELVKALDARTAVPS